MTGRVSLLDAIATCTGFLFGMLQAIKVIHWTTDSYAVHMATDELHARLQDLTDAFVEASLHNVNRKHLAAPGRIRVQEVSVTSDPCSDLANMQRQLVTSAFSTVCKGQSALCTIVDEMHLAYDKARYLAQLDPPRTTTSTTRAAATAKNRHVRGLKRTPRKGSAA
jgi:Family of unknown function (DUF5856)